MLQIFGLRRIQAAIVMASLIGFSFQASAEIQQTPRDDSTAPGSNFAGGQAPWKDEVEAVRGMIPIAIANARTETVTHACDAGSAGMKFQTRLVKSFTDGNVQADAWSPMQGECVVVASAQSGSIQYVAFGSAGSSSYRMCPIGFTGDPYQGSSGCFHSNACPVGVFTPASYGSWQSGSGEGTAPIETFVSTALCILP